ncbi:cell division protein FtsQ/DivIB [Kytococcus sp. Marseille-QA3725]
MTGSARPGPRDGSRQRRVVRPEPGTRQRSPLWWVAPLLAVLLGLAGAWVAYGSGWWVVRSVDVQVESPGATEPWADEVADPAAVQRASGIRVGDRVATLRPEEAREGVEALPGVASAEVGRGLTGSVDLRVELEEAVARYDTGSGQEVLGASGEPITSLPADASGKGVDRLPEIELAGGLKGGKADRALARAVPTLALLSDGVQEEVRTYRATSAGLETELPDSRVVRWGHVTEAGDMRERESAVEAILAEQPPSAGATLDARQKGAVVVRE